MKFDKLPETAKKILTETGAYQEGHFKLSSGLHSNGYLQCALILQYPEYAGIIADNLAEKFRHKKPDLVLTPAVGGIVLGQELARVLGCRAIFAERVDDEMKLRRGFEIRENEKVLLAEDVTTTGGSVLQLKKIVNTYGGKVIGFTVICDRSEGQFKPPEGLEPWISLHVDTFSPENCPLCREGVPVNKPGSRWS